MNHNRKRSDLVWILVLLFLVFLLFPFYWMFVTSVKTDAEIYASPLVYWPKEVVWTTYKKLFGYFNFLRYMKNSLMVAVITMILSLSVSLLAAYAFSQMDFKGRDALFMLLVATMMVPGEILIIPNYVTLADLGWINTYKALILPWCASVFSIFLLKQQFSSIPAAYYKAARIDGCRRFRYLITVMVPMSKPAIVAIALLKLINSWNSYMWPLIVTNTNEMRTLPVALAAFSTEAGVQYNTLMAFSLMIISPILLVYFFARKYIIRGVSSAGLKG